MSAPPDHQLLVASLSSEIVAIYTGHLAGVVQVSRLPGRARRLGRDAAQNQLSPPLTLAGVRYLAACQTAAEPGAAGGLRAQRGRCRSGRGGARRAGCGAVAGLAA